MSQFIFEGYDFNDETGVASFRYRYDDGRRFEEVIQYTPPSEPYNHDVLDRALELAFLVIGTSYVKTFPVRDIVIEGHTIDQKKADFLNKVYGEGLSQYAFENQLKREDLPWFEATNEEFAEALPYNGEGRLVLQSGGKDSLLVASILQAKDLAFTPWYLSSGEHHPGVLDQLGFPLVTARRQIDRPALTYAANEGGRNGHVPITYIVQSLALIQAILLGKNQVYVSIAHEGEEPHAMIDDLQVTHQWSKTWGAEQLFQEYVTTYISPDLMIGSPLRHLTELRVSELFIEYAWNRYGQSFSSCNRANYEQGADNSELHWCGECPKCANSYLLFAPFLDPGMLKALFAGQDLFSKPMLQETFKGLLGVDGVMKPFECVGEIDELRYAYGLAQAKGGYETVSFDVPVVSFDYKQTYPAQTWAQLL